MGHYNGTNENGSAPDDAFEDVYSRFKDHCSSTRINTDLELMVQIRANHPDCHVTKVNPDKCNFVGFAAAGHMHAQLQTESDSFLAKRTYAPPKSRLDGGEGSLGQTIDFGYFKAEYQGQKFSFYIARWRDETFGRKYEALFILSPKATIDAEGHSTFADALILTASKWTVELHDEVYIFDGGNWDKSPKLWQAVQKSSWDDVILDPLMKQTLSSDVQNFFDSRAVYEEYAVPWKRGIILHGTPGCGKTISVKALMNALDKRDQPVASLYVKTFTGSCPEQEEYSIRQIFEKARVMAPCMLVFEDLDSLVKDKVRSYFLNEVDGLEDNNGILMVGSTNHLDRLDPGIAKRPSRFDRKYHFKIPGYKERILYCEYWKKKLERNSNIDFADGVEDVVAKLTEGFSFAYLKELFVQTLLTIVGGREHELDDEEAQQAAENTKVVEGSGSLVAGEGQIGSNAEDAKDKKAENEDKAAMPEVEIPEQLKKNPLMRVLRKQAIALWKDMDNSDDEAGVKTGKDEEEDEKPSEYRQQLRLLARHRR